ncbi:transglycosylase SLT domain-containing protein, partial [Desulfococcaceae bacterium OttesenSCG-928-F15]|nr:transglycosylase SLT domain-containing protein [Desulfococcaceae bacterium OttesenSCG-928-F15]
MKSSLLPLLCTGLLFFSVSCTAGFNGSSGSLSTSFTEEDGGNPSSFERRGHASFDQALDFYDAATDFCAARDYDAALEALDQAYDLILRAETRTPTDFQQRDDLRLTIAKRILEVHSSRKMGVIGTRSPIQVPVNNPHVQAEIRRFTGPEREFFKQSYRRSGIYSEAILKKLRERGLPEELVWLPLIESGYEAQALSPARALGLWQFIPSTGVRFGLKRELLVDERMDPEKST